MVYTRARSIAVDQAATMAPGLHSADEHRLIDDLDEASRTQLVDGLRRMLLSIEPT